MQSDCNNFGGDEVVESVKMAPRSEDSTLDQIY